MYAKTPIEMINSAVMILYFFEIIHQFEEKGKTKNADKYQKKGEHDFCFLLIDHTDNDTDDNENNKERNKDSKWPIPLWFYDFFSQFAS